MSPYIPHLECWIIVFYDETSTLESINEARRDLFCQKNKTMENIPLTHYALLQHTRRAVYQTGIWTINEFAQQEGHRLRVGGGLWKTNHGLPFGLLFQCLQKHAANLWSAAAKVSRDAILADVHARRQTGDVQNFVGAIAQSSNLTQTIQIFMEDIPDRKLGLKGEAMQRLL